MKKVIIATRGSQLALWQAEHVRQRLMAQYAGLEVELLVLRTKGDIILDVPLAKVGGKGLFVKEIEYDEDNLEELEWQLETNAAFSPAALCAYFESVGGA